MSKTEDELNDAVTYWEKEVNDFIEEIKKEGRKASKELYKQLTKLQDEGKAIERELMGEDETESEKMRDTLDDVGDKLVSLQNKLTRAWNELKK